MSKQRLLSEVEELRRRLEEAEDTLRAIRGGQVDAVIVPGSAGEQVFVRRGAEHPYRIFVETMNEGAVTITADGTIAFSNPRFAQMLNLPLQQVTGARLQEFVAPAHRERLLSLLRQTRAGNATGEIPFLTTDGKVE